MGTKKSSLPPFPKKVACPLFYFRVSHQESDILIGAARDLQREALRSLKMLRRDIESYIETNPQFRKSFKPLAVAGDAPPVVKAMAEAARRAGVGPMASVAGAITEFMGKDLLSFTEEIIVENGGDIFIKSSVDKVVGIYAGSSQYSGRLGIKVPGGNKACGVCTSSGTVGHSFSFGGADAVVVLASSPTVADAFATAIANTVHSAADVQKTVERERDNPFIDGLVVIFNDKMGITKNVELVDLK